MLCHNSITCFHRCGRKDNDLTDTYDIVTNYEGDLEDFNGDALVTRTIDLHSYITPADVRKMENMTSCIANLFHCCCCIVCIPVADVPFCITKCYTSNQVDKLIKRVWHNAIVDITNRSVKEIDRRRSGPAIGGSIPPPSGEYHPQQPRRD